MRMRFLLFLCLVVSSAGLLAQNNSLGVGTSTPNPNAVLHVESPTNNQGFLMPRLTTAQRTAPGFASILTTTDVGLMVYDTNLKAIFVWDGSKWDSPINQLQYPFADTVTTPVGALDVYALRYAAGDNARVMRLENNSPTNGSSTLSVLNQGTGVTGYFQVSNAADGGMGLYATTNSNRGGVLPPVAIYGETTGTGSLAAAFWNQNTSSTWASTFTKTLGLGPASYFIVENSSNSSPAVSANTNGTGAAVLGENFGNGFGIHGKSAGTEFATAAVYGEHTGTGDVAGAFRISNAANTYSALYGETNGTGSAIFGNHLGTAGRAGQFQIGNATNADAALRAFTSGTGRAGFFTINNVANASPTIFAETNGTGSVGNFVLNNAASTAAALNVETNADLGFGVRTVSSGREVAGYFQTTNAASNASTLLGMTNAPGGHGVGAINSGNGSAFSIFQGGMRVSTATLSAGTTITTRAVGYLITGGGPYTFDLDPGFSDGDMFFVYNATAGSVTVQGASINSNSGLLFLVMGGVPRPF